MTQSRTLELGDSHSITYLIGRAAYITQHFVKVGRNGRMSKIKAAYYAFDWHKQARRFYQVMQEKFGKFRVELRPAQRVLDWRWEVKVQGDFLVEEIEAIARDLDHFYPDTMPEEVTKQAERPVKTVANYTPGSSEWWQENFGKRFSKQSNNTANPYKPGGCWWLDFANQPKRDRRKIALFC
ncbi:MAG: hypothetical protein F6K14_08735 [Symploca sp. SIO2C1]|nr:hypothetical protein [Symploca sp. SIO2C1]